MNIKPVVQKYILFFMIFLSSLGLMIFIDRELGDTAEFFNAWNLFRVLFSTAPAEDIQFIHYQRELGGLAIPAALMLLAGFHGIIARYLTRLLRKWIS